MHVSNQSFVEFIFTLLNMSNLEVLIFSCPLISFFPVVPKKSLVEANVGEVRFVYCKIFY